MRQWFSFHGGHSGEFCRHANGTLHEVVEAAVERGFTTFGLSEHAPRDRVKDLLSDEQHMTPADLHAEFELYAAEARRLQEQLADRLELIIGFEAEVVPPGDYAERMLAIHRGKGFDYFVGSVHHVADTAIDSSAEQTAGVARDMGGVPEMERAYFDAVAAMVEALHPPVVGHLDLIRKYRGDRPDFESAIWPHIERALESVAAAGAVLEVNSSTARRGAGPPYPALPILRRARELGIGVTLGDDSHGPADVGVGLEASRTAIADAGYREISCLRRRDGEVRWEPVPIDQVLPIRTPS